MDSSATLQWSLILPWSSNDGHTGIVSSCVAVLERMFPLPGAFYSSKQIWPNSGQVHSEVNQQTQRAGPVWQNCSLEQIPNSNGLKHHSFPEYKEAYNVPSNAHTRKECARAFWKQHFLQLPESSKFKKTIELLSVLLPLILASPLASKTPARSTMLFRLPRPMVALLHMFLIA